MLCYNKLEINTVVCVGFQWSNISGSSHEHGNRIVKWQRRNGNADVSYQDRHFLVSPAFAWGFSHSPFCQLMYSILSFSQNFCFLTGNGSGRLRGCRCFDRFRWWGEWEAAGGGGAAVCPVHEVVHCGHVCHWHCVCAEHGLSCLPVQCSRWAC